VSLALATVGVVGIIVVGTSMVVGAVS